MKYLKHWYDQARRRTVGATDVYPLFRLSLQLECARLPGAWTHQRIRYIPPLRRALQPAQNNRRQKGQFKGMLKIAKKIGTTTVNAIHHRRGYSRRCPDTVAFNINSQTTLRLPRFKIIRGSSGDTSTVKRSASLKITTSSSPTWPTEHPGFRMCRWNRSFEAQRYGVREWTELSTGLLRPSTAEYYGN